MRRTGICDVPGLMERLVATLKEEEDCSYLGLLSDLDEVEENTRAMAYLQGVDSFSWETWWGRLPLYLQEAWGRLTHRERALLYLMAKQELGRWDI